MNKLWVDITIPHYKKCSIVDMALEPGFLGMYFILRDLLKQCLCLGHECVITPT